MIKLPESFPSVIDYPDLRHSAPDPVDPDIYLADNFLINVHPDGFPPMTLPQATSQLLLSHVIRPTGLRMYGVLYDHAQAAAAAGTPTTPLSDNSALERLLSAFDEFMDSKYGTIYYSKVAQVKDLGRILLNYDIAQAPELQDQKLPKAS